jgi:hypothetical protein
VEFQFKNKQFTRERRDSREPNRRRHIGKKADKSIFIRPMHQEINMISINRKHHVFLSEAYQPIPTEEAEPIEPMIDKQAIDNPEWEKWHEAKECENAALAYKKVMVLVDNKPGMTVMKSKHVFKIKKKFGKLYMIQRSTHNSTQ